jgi:CheY-like chemotaxis protein
VLQVIPRRAKGWAVPTILVVVNDDGVRQLIVDLLEIEGYHVLTAVDGRQGLDILSIYKPDLVICDVALPLVSGIDLARTLRADPRYRALPVVAISGSWHPAAAERLFSAILAKPFSVDALLSTVADVLVKAR